MALIIMAVFDTEENQRTKYTIETIESLKETVDLSQHTFVVVNNASCADTYHYIDTHCKNVIHLPENIGTAKAINKGMRIHKQPNQHVIKMDNDVVIHSYGWVEELEEAIEVDKSIGIIGLKRKDLMESPHRNDQWKSTLRMLPHQNGERWIIVEDVDHVMGTCQMYNWRLLDKIGGLMQPKFYGFDDTLSAIRCKIAGFKNCFLPHIEIDHIDVGGDAYTEEKRRLAKESQSEFYRMKFELENGTMSIRYEY